MRRAYCMDGIIRKRPSWTFANAVLLGNGRNFKITAVSFNTWERCSYKKGSATDDSDNYDVNLGDGWNVLSELCLMYKVHRVWKLVLICHHMCVWLWLLSWFMFSAAILAAILDLETCYASWTYSVFSFCGKTYTSTTKVRSYVN